MTSDEDILKSAAPELPTSGLGRKAASGTAWSMGFQISRQLLSVVSVSVLARRVPPAAYGLLSMATIITNFVEIFRDLGTWTVLVREREVSGRLLASLFWLNLALGSLLSLSIALLSVPAAIFFHQPKLAPVMQALSLTFLITSAGVIPSALLYRRMAFRLFAIAQLAGAALGTTVAISAALMNAGVWSLVFGTLTSSLVTTCALWFANPWRPSFVIDWSELRRIVSYSLNLSAFNFVNFFSRNADNLIVGRFLGDTPLGYYQMAYTLMTYPLINFCQVIAGVVFAGFSSLQDDDARFRSAFLRVTMLVGFFSIPAMFGLMVVAVPFIRVVLGQKWGPVASLLMVFAPLGALQAVFSQVGAIYMVKGRTDWQFRWSLVTGSLCVASFLIGIRWGIQGVAIAYSIAWLITMVPGFAIPFRLIHLTGREFVTAVWPEFAGGLAMALVACGWRLMLNYFGIQSSAVHLFSTVVVGSVCYLGLMLWWSPPVIEELGVVLMNSPLSRFAPLLSRAIRKK